MLAIRCGLPLIVVVLSSGSVWQFMTSRKCALKNLKTSITHTVWVCSVHDGNILLFITPRADFFRRMIKICGHRLRGRRAYSHRQMHGNRKLGESRTTPFEVRFVSAEDTGPYAQRKKNSVCVQHTATCAKSCSSAPETYAPYHSLNRRTSTTIWPGTRTILP